MGNIKKVTYTHKTDPAKTMEYSYDNHNRLTQFKHQGSVLRSYAYDDNGNITSFTGLTLTYGNDNNQLTNDGSRSFTFDAIGRAITVGSATLKYDIFNNMTEHGTGNKYTYDGANQRLRKTENSDSTYYFTNGLQVLAEYDENDALQSEHIYGLGRMLAKLDPAVGHKFFYSDHLGSTRLVGGSSESSDDMRRDYYPYGEELTTAGNDDTPFTFTGKELDSATELHYFGARYYDPRIGRWLAPDPLAEKNPSLTPYHYVRNNPLVYIDLDGEEEFKVTIRTFIPYASVAGFRGDNRGPSTAENASSRTSHSIRVETNPNKSDNPLIKDEGGQISRTHTTIGNLSAQGKGTFTTGVTRNDANDGDNAVISTTGTATNPFDISGLTSIDYDFKISITPGVDGGTPKINVSGSHDGFPAYEINVTNEAGETFQVYFNGVESKWEVRKLLPPKDEKVEEEK